MNKCVYTAIVDLAHKGISTIDAYNILEDLNASEATRKFADELSLDRLEEMIDMSDVLARHSAEEYKLLVGNVMDAAFRRDMFRAAQTCQALCCDRSADDIEQRIYEQIDGVMTEFSTANEIPPFSEVVDDCWEEIKSRQTGGYEVKRDLAVLYLDSELNTRLFTARILAHLSGIEYKRLTSGSYTEDEAKKIDEARAWLKTRKFTHIYIPMFDQQTIYTSVKKVKHQIGVDVLIVDYFKGSSLGDAFESYQELGKFVDTVKNRLCGEMNIAGIGAAQATSSGKVADSAKIGRNASTIAIIQDKTAEELAEDGPECGNKKLRVVLNRNGMQMADGEYLDLKFDGNHIQYTEAKQHIPHTPF